MQTPTLFSKKDSTTFSSLSSKLAEEIKRNEEHALQLVKDYFDDLRNNTNSKSNEVNLYKLILEYSENRKEPELNFPQYEY